MTLQQKIAADPAHSVWVSANAGSGKTRVLTDRVLRLLLQGVLPHRILCLTYTKAAAAEMALRVQKKLSEWVTSDDIALAHSLQQLTQTKPDTAMLLRARRLFAQVVDAPEGIRIQTIHSLCQSLLRRFAIEAGVSPHFRLMEDQETHALLQEAKERLFLSHRRGEDGEKLAAIIRQVAGTIAQTTFDELIREIISQRSDLEAILEAGLEHFQQKLIMALEIDYRHVTEQELAARHFHYMPEEIEALRKLVPALHAGSEKTDVPLGEALSAWLQCCAQPQEQERMQWIGKMLTRNNPRVLKTLFTNAVRKKDDSADALLGREIERAYAFQQQRAALNNAIMSEHVWHIAAALLELYRDLKIRRGLLDYEDLIGQASRLLSRPRIAPWVLYKLDGGIDHLLVDEAQDTSRVQWKLIEAIATEFFVGESAAKKHRTLFVVGDEKQSIYSFQGAEPRAFAEMKQFFARQIQSAQKSYQPVNLSLSFRSAAAILRAVDAVFAKPEVSAGVIFSENAVLHQAQRNTPGRVELWPLCRAEEESEREAWSIPEEQVIPELPQRMLAEKIAGTIGGWLREKRLLSGHSRPVRAGDIIILVRNRDRFFEFLISALKSRDIPLAGADRLTLSEHIAVQDMQALAQFLLLPEDDLNLACLLKSPLFNVSEEQLFTLCHGRSGTLWTALKDHLSHWERSKSSQAISGEGVAMAAEKLTAWLNAVDFLPPFEMFSRVLEAEGGRKAFVARMGEEVSDPLSEFLALALHYEQLHQPSLQGFLHWFQQSEVEIKRDMEQSRDEVRVLTVHGAKGLEAPIVFLPDTTGLPRPRERVLMASPDLFLWSYSAEEDCNLVQQLRQTEKDAAMEEYRRLLYVAMTRAADELYICGWSGRKTIPEDCWYQWVKNGMAEVAEVIETVTEDGEVLETLVCADNLSHWERSKDATQLSGEGVVRKELPPWLTQPAPEEPLPPRPLTPSKPEGAEPAADSPTVPKEVFERGKIIHTLLEVLPEMPESQWQEAGMLLLRRAGIGKPQELLEEVRQVLHHPQFAPIFAQGSQAEVPITATLMKEGRPRILSGQIDRLLVTEEKILVLDYKTNRQIPASAAQIPDYYRRQLASYAEALALIYPHRTIETAILWTSAPLLMPLTDELILPT